MTDCKVCGMHLGHTTEYHPYGVCLMMLGARSVGKSSSAVIPNLRAIIDDARDGTIERIDQRTRRLLLEQEKQP